MKIIYPLVFTLLIFIGCKKTSSNENHHNTESIELNDGKKWKVVDDMLAIIRAMESDISMFDTTSTHQALALTLQQNIDSLTSNCTMKGKAHDELHKWLVPYMTLVDQYEESPENKKEFHYNELLNSFELFNTYFN